MEIKRHFAFAAEKHPELVHYLNMTFAPWKRGEIVSSLDIKESDFRWPTIAAYLKLHDIPSYATPIFTKEELSSAPWLRVRSNWHFSYPQPEEGFGYKTTTYDPQNYCHNCGSGLLQTAPFRMKSAPKWGRRHFLSLNWVFDELFTDDAGKAALEAVEGLSFLEVLKKKGTDHFPGVHQLVISHLLPPGLLPNEQTIRKISICPKCGTAKHVTIGAGMLRFRSEIFDGAPDIVKTAEVFGDGQMSCRVILVRQKVYRLLVDAKLDGSLVFEPVELIEKS